ncbi:MAG: TIM barrel protein [Thermoplasmatota archaeon]
MIRFGPSGIPLSCKGRTLLDGVKDVHKLGLSALEVQFLRMNVRTRPVQPDEVDLKAKEVPGKFIIGVNRGTDYKTINIKDMNKTLEHGDMVHFLSGGVSEEFYRFPKIGELSKELDVRLTLHTPYYMKFTEMAGELVEKSKLGFKYGGVMAGELGSDIIVTHVGIIDSDTSKDDAKEAAVKNLRGLRNWLNDKYPRGIKIGVETQGGEDVYGNLDEVLEICKKVSGTVPVINFAHVRVNEEYPLDEPEDFGEVFNACRKFVESDYYVSFSGVEIRPNNEYRLTPIKRGDLQFEPLVEYLIESNENVTIISNSPLKEHDAMYMRVIFERLFSRWVTKHIGVEDK